MTLGEVIRRLDTFDEEWTIYVSEPWSATSRATVALAPESGDAPPEAKAAGLSYFLEVFIAKEFVDGWIRAQNSNVTVEATCARLIRYAADDA